MPKKTIIELSVQELLARKSRKFIKRNVKDSEIDFSDIPEITDKQIRKLKRPGRPIIGESPRTAISIRIEASILERIKKKAKLLNVGYQSLINEILRKAI